MKRMSKRGITVFDRDFDQGKATIDFSEGVRTEGLSKMVRIPPMEIPVWLAAEIDQLASIQGNSRTSVIRQLLATAMENKVKASGRVVPNTE